MAAGRAQHGELVVKGCQAITAADVAAVYLALDGRLVWRDRALWLTGVTTGLRISELLSLDWQDALSGQELRCQVLVRRRRTKGQVSGRVVALQPVALETLERWRLQAHGWMGARRDWPVFATSTGRRLTRQQAYRVLRRGYERAGLRLATWGTHVMRKTFAAQTFADLCRRRAAGEPIEPLLALQEQTGHVRLDTLQNYLATQGLAGATSVATVAAGYAEAMAMAIDGGS